MTKEEKKQIRRFVVKFLTKLIIKINHKNIMFIGGIVLLLGAAFLLKNLGILTDVTWSVVWPAILVVIGLCMMFKKKKKFWE